MANVKLKTNKLKLFISRKDTNKAHPDYGTDMRTIERWGTNVAATLTAIKGSYVKRIVAGTHITITPAGGTGVVTINSTATGGYASLTGPGKTTTPGKLTQKGPFTIQVHTGSHTPHTQTVNFLMGHYTSFNVTIPTATLTAPTTFVIRAGYQTFTSRLYIINPTGKGITIYGRNVQISAFGTGGNNITITGRQVSIDAYTHSLDLSATRDIIMRSSDVFMFVGSGTGTPLVVRRTITHSPNQVSVEANTNPHLQFATPLTASGNSIRFRTGHMGFFTATPVSKPSATSYATLITGLQNLGLITGTAPITAVGSTALVAGTHITIVTTAGKAKISSTAGGTGTVTSVSSPTGTITVATSTTTVKIKILKTPSGSLVAGTHITITNTGGKAKITATTHPTGAAGGGLTGTYPNPTVAKAPSGSLVAGTRITITTTAGKAKITATVQTATGTAGGDLTGTYPNPTVAKIRGHAVKTAAPTTGQVLKWVTATSEYVPSIISATRVTMGGTNSGTSTNTRVTGIRGHNVKTVTPTTGQALIWVNATGEYVPTDPHYSTDRIYKLSTV